MKKILFITSFPLQLNTSATIQNLIMIDGLYDLGFSIDVVTTAIDKNHISYDDTLSIENINKYFELEMPKFYKSARSKKNQSKIKFFIKIILKSIYNEIEVYDGYKSVISKINNLNDLEKSYDFIISSSDPKSSHLLAYEIIKKYNFENIKWIQYWGDPMSIDISRKKKKFLEFSVKKEEKKLLKEASKIIYATPLTVKEQKNIYPEFAHKMSYVTQGYWKKYATFNTVKNEKFTVGYFGSYNPKIRNILPFYNSNNSSDFYIYIGGNGMDLNNKKNTEILGFLNHQQIMEYEKKCDLLICVLNNKGTQIPGKLYYYSSFKKPILIIKDGENGNEIEKFLSIFNRFYFCDNNHDAISQKIKEIKNNQETEFIVSELLSPKYIAKKVLEDNS